jgi:hypothetical protein
VWIAVLLVAFVLAIPLLLYLGVYFAIWAVVLYLLIKGLRPRSRSSARFRRFVYVPLIGIVAWYPMWDLFPGPLLVGSACERYGGLHTYAPTPIRASGYVYESDPVHLDTELAKRVGDQLVASKLAFIELKGIKHSGRDEPWVYFQHFYLDTPGDASCLKPSNYGLAAERLQPAGGRCLARSSVEKPTAPIVVTRDDSYRTFFPTTISWTRHTFADAQSKTLLAEHMAFKYHLFWGLLNTGATCPSKATGFDVFTSNLVRGS